MKVKLLISRSGVDGAFSPGDVIDVDEKTAQRMFLAGQCQIMDKKPEKATRKQEPEKATAK